MTKNKLCVPDGSVAVCVQLNSDHIVSSTQTACKLNLDQNCIAVMHSKNHKPVLIKGNKAVSKSVIGEEACIISTAEMDLHPFMNLRILHPSTNMLCRINFALDIQFHIKDPFRFLESCPCVYKLDGELCSLTDSVREALEMTFIPLLQSIMGMYSLHKIETFFDIVLFKATCEALNPLGIFVDRVKFRNFCINSTHSVRRTCSPVVHHRHAVLRNAL